jgi:hypothetical protein
MADADDEEILLLGRPEDTSPLVPGMPVGFTALGRFNGLVAGLFSTIADTISAPDSTVAAPVEAGLAGNPVHSCSPSEHDEDEGPNFVVSPNVDIDENKLALKDVTLDPWTTKAGAFAAHAGETIVGDNGRRENSRIVVSDVAPLGSIYLGAEARQNSFQNVLPSEPLAGDSLANESWAHGETSDSEDFSGAHRKINTGQSIQCPSR